MSEKTERTARNYAPDDMEGFLAAGRAGLVMDEIAERFGLTLYQAKCVWQHNRSKADARRRKKMISGRLAAIAKNRTSDGRLPPIDSVVRAPVKSGFVGNCFADDPRAAAPEPPFRRRPEPARSLSGSSMGWV